MIVRLQALTPLLNSYCCNLISQSPFHSQLSPLPLPLNLYLSCIYHHHIALVVRRGHVPILSVQHVEVGWPKHKGHILADWLGAQFSPFLCIHLLGVGGLVILSQYCPCNYVLCPTTFTLSCRSLLIIILCINYKITCNPMTFSLFPFAAPYTFGSLTMYLIHQVQPLITTCIRAYINVGVQSFNDYQH
jgi:hypothetical protein